MADAVTVASPPEAGVGGPSVGEGAWTRRSLHQPVMGTHLEVQVTAADEATAARAEQAVVAEAMRLASAFTVFDESSELCRWRAGRQAQPSAELGALLGLAADWQRRSGGAFNPHAGVLAERWLAAEGTAEAPSAEVLATLAASIEAPRFERADVPGGIRRLGPCDHVDLNALAKGHVVDRAAEAAMASGAVHRLVVNAGGDLVHRGAGVLRVRVEDPHRPYDNVAPLTRIEVANQAVATSGRARRWFSVAGRRWSRVLDPRSGMPADAVASATVVAPDAATADVLATVASVLAPRQAIDLVDRLAAEGFDAACLVVDADAHQWRSTRWPELER